MASPMIRGFLKILVLKALEDGSQSGYSLMKYVEDKMGEKPSPGSMYPLLKQLKKDKLVDVKTKGKSNEYSLTSAGKKELRSLEKKRDESLKHFMDGMKMLSVLTGHDMTAPIEMMKRMQKGEMPLKEINPEWDIIQHDIMILAKKGKLKKNSAKIKKILAKTHKELKEV